MEDSYLRSRNLNIIINYFSEYNFEASNNFKWSKNNNTIYYCENSIKSNEGLLLLLHEVNHALLNHSDYSFDIELINMEASAWAGAEKLSEQFSIKFNKTLEQECINSYKNWLDSRSECVICSQTGIQKAKSIYFCFNCEANWKVNNAKFCELRRYKNTSR